MAKASNDNVDKFLITILDLYKCSESSACLHKSLRKYIPNSQRAKSPHEKRTKTHIDLYDSWSFVFLWQKYYVNCVAIYMPLSRD